jgi:seryl-tRNA synthetase
MTNQQLDPHDKKMLMGQFQSSQPELTLDQKVARLNKLRKQSQDMRLAMKRHKQNAERLEGHEKAVKQTLSTLREDRAKIKEEIDQLAAQVPTYSQDSSVADEESEGMDAGEACGSARDSEVTYQDKRSKGVVKAQAKARADGTPKPSGANMWSGKRMQKWEVERWTTCF